MNIGMLEKNQNEVIIMYNTWIDTIGCRVLRFYIDWAELDLDELDSDLDFRI